MSDDDLDGDRLRAAFRHGGAVGKDPRGVDADDFLARVHRGGKRRRARRTAGVVTAAAAAVGAIATGVTVVAGDLDPADPPVAQGGATGTPSTGRSATPPTAKSTTSRIAPEESTGPLAVYDLQVPDDRSVWALASPDCGRATLCPVIVHSTDEGKTWRARSPGTSGGEPVITDFRHLGVADNGTDLVVAGTGVATSHDAGENWQPVELAGDRPVRGIATGADEAVVVFDEADADALATSPVDVDDWTTADAPFSAGERVGVPFAGADVVGATVTADDSPDTVGLVARSTGSDWVRIEAPCSSRAPRVATDGATLWYLCFGGPSSTLATADVAGGLQDLRWATRELPSADDAGLGAWGDGTAVVSTGKQMFRVDPDGGTIDLSVGPRGVDLGRDDYTVRDTDKGWLASFRGRLLRTPDDGRSWSRVPVTLR